ncbi:M48 family metallopeptidase [Eisenibacter elegans]|uniref:M48 family metallopeptidase n=1 Tax=Eisenibacter elegans TaxID=997 RepID=UPI0012B54725|nr:SprT family zinc-dependent metalloprotease [Eisenibacter elegans]
MQAYSKRPVGRFIFAMAQEYPQNYTIQKKQVKYARIHVDIHERVKITVPLHYTKTDIQALLRRKQAWIDKHIGNFRQRKDAILLAPDQLLWQGQPIAWQYQPELLPGTWQWQQQPPTLITSLDLSQPLLQEAWYKAQAKAFILPRVAELAQKHGFRYKKVFIRSQRTKWGTCSSLGNLSFNWKLIKAPAFVLDYVILHELAHTEIMDHSPRFWVRVAALDPDYEQATAWLQTYGHNL